MAHTQDTHDMFTNRMIIVNTENTHNAMRYAAGQQVLVRESLTVYVHDGVTKGGLLKMAADLTDVAKAMFPSAVAQNSTEIIMQSTIDDLQSQLNAVVSRLDAAGI